MATDPVCGMKVDAKQAAAKARPVHPGNCSCVALPSAIPGGRCTAPLASIPSAKVERAGQTYYFCSDACHKAFSASPEKYLKKPQEDGHGGHAPKR